MMRFFKAESSAHRRDLAILLAMSLAVRLLAAWPLRVPGYMDAYYYFVGAERIVAGQGMTDPYLWNYLGYDLSLPAPAFQYWLPLTSFLIVPFMALFGTTFRAAQIPFVLLSAVLPPIAYLVSQQLAPSRRRAWVAGLLMLFTPFYIKYWVSPDNFAPFAVAGCLALLAMQRGVREEKPAWFALAGALIGLGHLARADAPLLFGVLFLVGLFPGAGAAPLRWRAGRLVLGWLLAAAAYLLVMGPWFWRNVASGGPPLGAAGAQTLFLRNYDDLFNYGQTLTLQSYLAWGWPAILRSKLDAALSNLTTVVVVFLLFFLAPLAAVELWARRRELLGRLTALYLILLYLVMTLAFTFPGPRGSLLHSGGALLPLLMAYAAAGLDRAVAWVARRRAGWDARQASRVFSAGAVILAAGFSVFLYVRAVWAGGDATQAWNTHDEAYRVAGAWLDQQGVPLDAPIMVVNPPSFYYFTRRLALAAPNAPPADALTICRRFGAAYLLLGVDRPAPLNDFYAGRQDEPALRLVQTWTSPEAKLYQCLP